MSDLAAGRFRDEAPGLPAAFAEMSASMAALDAPMYAAICAAVAEDLVAGGPSVAALAGFESARVGDMVPLRLLASVHRLVLERRLPGLATFYPDVGGSAPPHGPAGAPARAMMATMFLGVLRDHLDEVRAGLAAVPQTNETGRSAALAGVLRLVDAEWGVPVDLHELGASAGLNLRADAYRFEPAGLGPEDSRLVVDDVWDPAAAWVPPPGPLRVATRTGCDLSPIDPLTTEGRLRLTSYLWPDHAWRYERLRTALAIARQVPATLVRATAEDHVAGLALRPGHALLVWHSAMWMYPTTEQRTTILRRLAGLGATASRGSPLVHLAFEPMGGDRADPYRFLLVLTTWPGLGGRDAGVPYLLATAPAHGVPLTWQEPEPVDLADLA